ncbi:MAG: thiamine phosphate synthase [Bacteroidales bacterium]|nr:MAG: thiamine phosphate synthase [Bacteroidales bacterium]
MNNKIIERFHFITDGVEPGAHISQITGACEGGCKWVQLRVKDFDNQTWLNTAIKAKNITGKYNAKLIINDNVEITREVGAAGTHLGKTDMSIRKARDILGESFIIGGTANTFKDIITLYYDAPDYIGLGPYRFTTTKKKLSPVLGMNGFLSILTGMKENNINIPVIAIGGIKEDDISYLINNGLHGVAVSSLIVNAEDITVKTRAILDNIKNIKT